MSIAIAYMLGLILITIGVVVGNYTSGLIRQRTMNNLRREVGLGVKPIDFKYKR